MGEDWAIPEGQLLMGNLQLVSLLYIHFGRGVACDPKV